MNDQLAEALHHLLWVWDQYGKFEHQCMQAGEQALDMLERYGLAEDTGWGVSVTPAGRALMGRDFTGWTGP